jgi:hypothetical protein
MSNNLPAPVHHLPSPTEGIVIDREAVLVALKLNPRDPNTQALLLVCERYNLDPLLKHMVLIKGNAYVTRDGYLTIAHRSGQFDGMEVLEQGETPSHFTAKVAVYRRDMSRPFSYVGRFPKNKDMAKEYGPEMAVKVAEVQALRRAFNVTGIGAADEQWEADAVPAAAPLAAEADPNVADDWDRQSLAARIAELDDEHRAILAGRWKLPKVGAPTLTKADVDAAFKLIGDVTAEADATYDRRRKHVMAKMGEAGITTDDARHELVKFCTEGRTESTKRLTQADVDSIVAYVEKMAADEAAAS